MGNTRTVTFTGFTGRYSPMNDFAISLTRSGCEWYGSGAFFLDCWEGYNVLLFCEDGKWYITLELASWGEPGSGTCDDAWTDLYESQGRPPGQEPPDGNYTMEWQSGTGAGDKAASATLGTP